MRRFPSPARVPRAVSALALAALLAAVAGCGRSRAPREVAWDALPNDAGLGMYEYVADLVKTASPRDAGTLGAARASRWIAQELKRMGLRPEADCWTETTPQGRKTFCNVYVDFPGTSGQTVLLVSHYDTKSGIPGFQGANDGGSSVGILLGLAEHFVSHRLRLRNTVRLAFVDGEEAVGSYHLDSPPFDGLHGSSRLARHYEELWREARDRSPGRIPPPPLLACIVLDMVGDRNLRIDIPRNSSVWLARAAMRAAEERDDLPVVTLATSWTIDDHVPFIARNFSAIDFIDFEYGSAAGRHDYWHTPEDTLDKISARSLHRSASLALALLARIEAGTEVPRELLANDPGSSPEEADAP